MPNETLDVFFPWRQHDTASVCIEISGFHFQSNSIGAKIGQTFSDARGRLRCILARDTVLNLRLRSLPHNAATQPPGELSHS